MSLFRRRKGENLAGPQSASGAPANSGADGPRHHHYQFAHRALRPAATGLGERLLKVVEEGRLDELLLHLWHYTGEQLPEAERLEPDGLSGRSHVLAGHTVLVVTMPPAERTTEAHFVALVLTGTSVSRYLVLEFSWTTGDRPVTVLGEWTDTAHVNRGESCPPNVDAFLLEVARVLAA